MKIPSNHSNGTVEMLARWGGGDAKPRRETSARREFNSARHPINTLLQHSTRCHQEILTPQQVSETNQSFFSSLLLLVRLSTLLFPRFSELYLWARSGNTGP